MKQHTTTKVFASKAEQRRYEQGQKDKVKGTLVEQAAFALETIGHLQGHERELLPLAEHLREIAEAARTKDRAEDPAIPKLSLEEQQMQVMGLVIK